MSGLLLAALLAQADPPLNSPEAPVRLRALEELARRERRSSAARVVPLLADRDPGVAWQAAFTLLAMEARDVAPSLVPLLKDAAGELRPNVVHALGRLGRPEHGPLVAPLLEDAVDDVRVAAVRLLGELGSRAHAGAVAKQLGHPDPAHRLAALTSLADMGARDFAAPIAERLGDAQFLVRWEAARALGRLRASEHATAVIALLQDEGAEPPVIEAIGALGRRDSAPHLLPYLEHFDPGIRWRAVRALGQIDAFEDAAPLVAALGDLEDYVRLMAVRALGELGSRASAGAVFERLRDPNTEVVHAAFWETLYLGGAAEEKALPGLLGHPDPVVREAALELLAAGGRRESLPAVRTLLRDSDGAFRWRVVRALGRLGEDPAVLKEALAKGDPLTRPQAVFALARVAPGETGPLEALLQEAASPLRLAAGFALGRGGRPEQRRRLAEFLEHSRDPDYRHLADELLDLLLRRHAPALAAGLERDLKAAKRIETRADLDALLNQGGIALSGAPPGPLKRRLPAGTSLKARHWISAALGEELRLVPSPEGLRALEADAAFELWQKRLDGE